MPISPSDCSVFVQVWVDVVGLQQGSSRGCYAVSNRCNSSQGEGTANLKTKVISGSRVCWAVLPIDPRYNGDFTIQDIGVQSGWAESPAPVDDKPNIWTGQVALATVRGDIDSNISFNYAPKHSGEGSHISVTIPVTIEPIEKE